MSVPVRNDNAAPPRAIVIHLDVQTPNPLNGAQGRHWSVISKRRKAHRQLAMYATIARVRRPRFPIVVTLTRLSAGRLDSDGLLAALKSLRDGVADGLGLRDDNDPRVTWKYEQETAPRKKYGVEIVIDEGES